MKKGELTLDFLGKIILSLVVIVVVMVIIYLFREKVMEFIANFPKLFRTGG